MRCWLPMMAAGVAALIGGLLAMHRQARGS